ncbi:hypothetical protein [Sedimentibacter sp. MB31-C6]|uniref:hypothetical protein n=1 Tax=Sedimentibacter sp. MB31-C6 TaxID=3109366 RepID=UPI002DDCB70F|nr:hypothetical protein [Sedimentibacter sp. MB36-C1]WSI04956.1 hypothetical protein U8307_03965 [Sedimentibacter sp. MB36-C1]
MIDNDIRVSTKNPLSDNTLNKQKIKTEPITPFDVIDPTKVTKPNKQDPSNHTSQNWLNYNPDSVFEKFLKSLGNSPILSDNLKKLLLNNQFINHNIKNDPVLNTLFETFIKNIEMDDKEILNFLKLQQNTYTKFNGDFFNSLRNLYKLNSNNEDFKIILRNFLRSYDCFVSINDTYKSINSTLKNIHENIPDILKEPFKELLDKMVTENYTKSNDLNLNLLKNEILPFIGRYVSKMNDFGPVRDYVSVLVHNLIRLETASKDTFSTDLDNLFDYIKFNLQIEDKELNNLKLSLINSYETSSNTKNNSIDSLIDIIRTGIKDSNNVVNKGVMEDMADSLLFNQSVHIPLMHLFMPLNYNGMFMFSELWISKDYEDYTENKKSNYEKKETFNVFITFEIQNVGYFETTLLLKDNNLSLEILIPNKFVNHIDKIRNDISEIIQNKNISISDINVSECIKRRRFNEVFDNLAERKNGVNVVI